MSHSDTCGVITSEPSFSELDYTTRKQRLAQLDRALAVVEEANRLECSPTPRIRKLVAEAIAAGGGQQPDPNASGAELIEALFEAQGPYMDRSFTPPPRGQRYRYDFVRGFRHAQEA